MVKEEQSATTFKNSYHSIAENAKSAEFATVVPQSLFWFTINYIFEYKLTN